MYGSVVCMATLLPACTPNKFHFVEGLFLPPFSWLTGIWHMKSLGQCIKFWMVLWVLNVFLLSQTDRLSLKAFITHIWERERERLLTQIDRHAPRSYFQRCRFRHSIETLQSIVPYQVFVSVFVFLMILNIFHNDQWWCCRTIRSSLYLMLSKRKLPCEDIKVTFSVLTVDRKKPKLKGPHHSPKIWG